MPFFARIAAFTAAACLTLSPAFADSNAPDKPTAPGKPAMSKPGKPPKTTSGSTPTTTSTSTSSGSTSTTNTSPTPLNPIAAKIASKPNLSAKVSAMLPTVNGKTMTLNDASMGFKNQGQFIAALHVAQNLHISFTDLKNQMVTKTGTGATAEMKQTGSLGQAIQAVKKTANATTEADKAEKQAGTDLTTTSSSTAPAKNKKKTTQTGGDQ